MSEQVLIFSDLDGTLLDHDTYSHAPADALLARLKKADIPVIPTTSKTYAEVIVLRQQLALNGPYIIENGAAIYIPQDFFPSQPPRTQLIDGYWVHQFTAPKQDWLALLAQIAGQFNGLFEHFSSMSNERISQTTGLSPADAIRAAERQYGEPILWLGDERQKRRFIQALEELGATPLQGGRFIHLSGDCDKGMALHWMVTQCKLQRPESDFISIALGDGGNDVAMLEAADIAVRILSPANTLPILSKTDKVYTSTLPGPAGWSECLSLILTPHL